MKIQETHKKTQDPKALVTLISNLILFIMKLICLKCPKSIIIMSNLILISSEDNLMSISIILLLKTLLIIITYQKYKHINDSLVYMYLYILSIYYIYIYNVQKLIKKIIYFRGIFLTN